MKGELAAAVFVVTALVGQAALVLSSVRRRLLERRREAEILERAWFKHKQGDDNG